MNGKQVKISSEHLSVYLPHVTMYSGFKALHAL